MSEAIPVTVIFPFTYSSFSFATVGLMPLITTFGAVVSDCIVILEEFSFPALSFAFTEKVFEPSLTTDLSIVKLYFPLVFETLSEEISTLLF